MVQRMTAPKATSAMALSEEVGVPQPTLSRWLREAATVDDVAKPKRLKPKPSKVSSRSPGAGSSRTAEEKVSLVLESAGLGDAALGAWLREKGLHEEDLARFREEVRNAAVAGLSPKPAKEAASDKKRIKELERELKRSNAALAETAAILVLRKKAVALWGEEGEDT